MQEQPPKNPVLIIVSGPPGAGKSTLARCLADHIQLPLIQKEMIVKSN